MPSPRGCPEAEGEGVLLVRAAEVVDLAACIPVAEEEAPSPRYSGQIAGRDGVKSRVFGIHHLKMAMATAAVKVRPFLLSGAFQQSWPRPYRSAHEPSAPRRGTGARPRLWTGERIGKDDLRVEAYGCLDELSSFLGMARHALRPRSYPGGHRVHPARPSQGLRRACLSGRRARPGPSVPRTRKPLTAAVLALEDRIRAQGLCPPRHDRGLGSP